MVLEATCTRCDTTWELDDDYSTCPGCGATSYTVPRADAWAYSLQQKGSEGAAAYFEKQEASPDA